ncbi:hypothetical protein GCM10010390_54260 [Streptomyces mordarskii]|uniref:Uncharacterized protein n=1 Tax=Streptomyces mordarskii TaxID=1226758 RepID=A0ABP3NJ78_9ACTN
MARRPLGALLVAAHLLASRLPSCIMTSPIEALIQQLDVDDDASYAAGNGRRWPFNTEHDHLLHAFGLDPASEEEAASRLSAVAAGTAPNEPSSVSRTCERLGKAFQLRPQPADLHLSRHQAQCDAVCLVASQ